MAEFPTSVRIGAMDYRIEQWEPRGAQGAGRYGEFCGVEQVIRIDTSQHPQRVRETLLHEIMHGVYRAQHFHDVSNPDEEFLVASSASGLTQVMVDNPDLVAWFVEAWGAERQNSGIKAPK